MESRQVDTDIDITLFITIHVMYRPAFQCHVKVVVVEQLNPIEVTYYGT